MAISERYYLLECKDAYIINYVHPVFNKSSIELSCCTLLSLQTIELPLKDKKYISCIKVIAGRIWISTVGHGLFVYNASSLEYEGSWGDREKVEIFNMLSVEEASCIIALTSKGIFSFEAEINNTRLFDYLDFTKCRKEDLNGLTMNIGVVVPSTTANVAKCEVWLCSITERRFFVLNPYNLSTLEEVVDTKERDQQSRHDGRTPLMLTSIKDLQVVEVEGRLKVGVADNWMVLLWDVENRKLERDFNCKEYCTKYKDNHSGTF